MIAVIEKNEEGNFGIYAPDEKGLFGFGETEQEAKNSFYEAVESQKEYYEENGMSIPQSFSSGIEWKYDISGFFLAFSFFNVSAFAQEIGINPSLMRKYKERISFASPKQKAMIQKKFNCILNRLNSVKF